MIVADTGAVLALMNPRDRHHEALTEVWSACPAAWVYPWAILAEVDYLLASRAGPRAQRAFLSDLATLRLPVEWGREDDLARALELSAQYADLGLGLVDASVMAVAERLEAEAVATLDLRHFGAVTLRGSPRLLPRDL